jgi:hypothetical protein
MKKKNLDFWGRPLPEFKPEFIFKFCPKCGAERNMMLWGSGAHHETARCVECKTEWVLVSPYKDDPLRPWRSQDGVIVGKMGKVSKNVVRWVDLEA